ncbi:MAG: cytochrome c3 family protein [Desulfobacteraceae bacterium]|jgi:hypothetical protein
MQKTTIVIVAAITLVMLSLIGAYCQEDMVEIDNQQFPAPQRNSARFEHDTHNEVAELEECSICHHVYDDNGNLLEDESSEDQMCSDCHGLADEGRQPGLRKAFHQNCKGCHLAQKKGPIMCGECHLNK